MAERKKKKAAKNWYSVLAPTLFGKAKIAETPSDTPEKVMGRVVEASMQEFTGDFAKAHIKLLFKVVDVSGFEARTAFVGHETTTDYVKRMARRHKSKIDGVFDVITKDGKRIRVKPSAYTNKRIQTSQKAAIRGVMRQVIETLAANNTLNDFVKAMLDGEIGKQTYKMAKVIFPVKRVEVHKSELLEAPTIEVIKEEEEAEAAETAPEGEEKPEEEKEEEAAEEPEEEPSEEAPEETPEEPSEETEETPEGEEEAAEETTEEEVEEMPAEEPSEEEEIPEETPEEEEPAEEPSEEEPEEPEEVIEEAAEEEEDPAEEVPAEAPEETPEETAEEEIAEDKKKKSE
ncbi:MAG TPA: 30S ribosomal protein S3ae [Thermoplasmatales archaeon]|nr:30S ribosomal protein S3ae [Thermoplasmatales archaeon]